MYPSEVLSEISTAIAPLGVEISPLKTQLRPAGATRLNTTSVSPSTSACVPTLTQLSVCETRFLYSGITTSLLFGSRTKMMALGTRSFILVNGLFDGSINLFM